VAQTNNRSETTFVITLTAVRQLLVEHLQGSRHCQVRQPLVSELESVRVVAGGQAERDCSIRLPSDQGSELQETEPAKDGVSLVRVPVQPIFLLSCVAIDVDAVPRVPQLIRVLGYGWG